VAGINTMKAIDTCSNTFQAKFLLMRLKIDVITSHDLTN